MVVEQVAAMAKAVLGHPIQAWQQPRRVHVPVATVKVKEIVWEPTPPPQLLCTVIQRGEEFEMLEEGEASMETKKLRVNLTSMIGRIEVSLKRSSLSLEEHSLLIHLSSIECDEGVRAAPAVAGGDDSSTGGEQESISIDERPLGAPAPRAPPQGGPGGEGSGNGEGAPANGGGGPVDG